MTGVEGEDWIFDYECVRARADVIFTLKQRGVCELLIDNGELE